MMAIRYPDSDCETHKNVVASDPVCIVCLESELSALREREKELTGLLGEIPNDYCPHCGDGSGGYPVPDGRGDFDIQQCRWCYEREALLATGGDDA